MERKKHLFPGKKGLKGFSNREKLCNKCGFVTFYLRVLYTHKYKCQGKLLGSMSCCYCKRKYNFLSSFMQHKKTCVKQYLKKKSLLKPKVSYKENQSPNKARKSFASKGSSPIVCPTCSKPFPSKHLYEAHSERGLCHAKSKHKKLSFSARKSLPNVHNKSGSSKRARELEGWDSSIDDSLHENLLKMDTDKTSNSDSALNMEENCICSWCKNAYPSKSVLLKHLEKNSQCAKAFYHRNSLKVPSKVTFSARKSIQPIVARKSFPNSQNRFHSMLNFVHIEGSARKSLPNSHKKFKRNSLSPLHSPMKSLNVCPVCYEEFPDEFSFFRHQKKLSHWGKATKSTNSSCKCPFCSKEFFSVRARNAHLRNHSDKSMEEIELFLKNTTCNICSQIFVSEMVKHQHIKIVHPRSMKVPVDLGTSENSHLPPFKENSMSSKNSLPLVLKQNLKNYPNTCPVCSKNFSSAQYRNKHFQDKHLNTEKKCKFCPMKYLSLEEADLHMQNSHSDSFKFKCLVCSINLATAPDVVKHISRRHPEEEPKKIIQCRVNESSSSDQPNIVEKSSYNAEIPKGKNLEYYCDCCNINFQKLCGLASHRQSKTHRVMMIKSLDEMHRALSNMPPSNPVPKKPVPQPEILVCNECSSEFTTIKDFVPHRLSHFSSKYMKINELNFYTCEICAEICDSHSKAQMHLFWHLQVQSTAPDKNPSKANDPIVPDRLSGQHVAKKSFSVSPESNQEVVIRGIKKSLYTCEACKIGFTTQAHYSIHVRKYCKVKNPASPKSNGSEEANNTPSSKINSIPSNNKSIPNVDEKTEYCSECQTVFLSTLATAHKNFCSKCQNIKSSSLSHVNKLKDEMKLKGGVATCISCNLTFINPPEFLKHMATCHESSCSNKSTNALCRACSCLFFSSEVLKSHETVCPTCSYDYDMHMNKEILEVNQGSAVAVCLPCGKAFGVNEEFIEHLSTHKSEFEGIGGKPSLSLNGSDSRVKENVNTASSTCEPSLPENSSEGKKLAEKLTSALPNNNNTQTESEDLIKLRDNFSQLFCLLIADPDLMEKLGYGVCPIDKVLVNVMEQMGLVPFVNNDSTEVECLRKNIRIFLDFVLKDQVMELIGSGKNSTDDIVIEALKTLRNDANVELATAE